MLSNAGVHVAAYTCIFSRHMPCLSDFFLGFDNQTLKSLSVFHGVESWQNKIWRLVKAYTDARDAAAPAPSEETDQKQLEQYIVDVFDARNYFLKEVKYSRTYCRVTALMRMCVIAY